MVGGNRNARKAFRIGLLKLEKTLTAWTAEQGVSRTHLYSVLEGERTPSAELAAKIAEVLEIAA